MSFYSSFPKGELTKREIIYFSSFSSLREMLYFLIWTIAINNMIEFIKRYKQNLAVKSVKTASDSFLQGLSCILNSKRLQPPKVTCLEPLLLEFRPLVATLMDSNLGYIGITPTTGISLPLVLIFLLQII